MPWDEFKDLISGLDPESPLGRMIQIRTEDNEDILREYTKDQKKIWNEWQRKKAALRSDAEVQSFIISMQEAFKNMAGDHY